MSARSQPFVFRKDLEVISWGPYTLDLNRGELLRATEPVKLRPKSYEALKYLVLNAGRLISRTELISAVWPDSASVSDDSVTHCIRDIRRAFGDGDGQAYIRTIPGRGYLFEAQPEAESGTDVHEAPIDTHEAAQVGREPIASPRFGIWTVAVPAIAIALAAGVWFWTASANRKWARDSIARVRQLAADRKYVAGYELATRVLSYLPSDPSVMRLMSELSDDVSVRSMPPGATVYLRRMGSNNVQHLGVTPIEHLSLARGEFIIKVSKPGYSDFEQTASSALDRSKARAASEIQVVAPLVEQGKTPAGMAPVPPGEHKLIGFTRATDATLRLGLYWIDKFEVSSQDYKKFIDQGGYAKASLWPGVELGGLRDKTGMPGPRNWSAGTFPEGKGNFPVTGVSWHEASAYCQVQGKSLPTLFQWEKAARAAMHTPLGVTFPWGLLDPTAIQERANFESAGPAPVDSYPFGMSPYGVYNMAGNVKEWVRNQWDDGYTTAGGSWADPMYQFGRYGSRAAMNAADTIGFRCALSAAPGADDGGMRFVSRQEEFSYPVSSDRDFEAAKKLYGYEKAPLNSAVVSVTETTSYRREEIDFDGFGGQRAKGYLYLPKNAAPPYQTIQFLSGTPWWYGVPITHMMEGKAAVMLPYVRSGRAMFLVVLKGFAGREPVGGYAHLEYGSPEHREILKNWSVDMQRSLDYLETRPEIDAKKIAFWNNSQYEYGAVFAAVDPRYAADIFIGTALYRRILTVTPELNPLFFFPHIRAPKLLMNGLYDDTRPITRSEGIWQLMREPKRREDFAGGHIPPPEIAVPIVNRFLDDTLGTVRPK